MCAESIVEGLSEKIIVSNNATSLLSMVETHTYQMPNPSYHILRNEQDHQKLADATIKTWDPKPTKIQIPKNIDICGG